MIGSGCVGRCADSAALFDKEGVSAVAQAGYGHGVDGSDAPAYKIAGQCAAGHAQHGAPVHALSYRDLIRVLLAVQEEIQRNDRANGRQGGVEEAEPAHKVIVEPDSGYRSDNASHDDHGALADLGDVGQAQAGGVEGVVVGGPDIGAENNQGRNHQPLSQHYIENIILAGKRAAHSAEGKHEGVAEEERNDGGENRGLVVFCKAGKVRGCGAAADKGAHYQAHTSKYAHAAGALCKDGAQATACGGGSYHGIDAENGNEGNGDIAHNFKALYAEVGRGCHANAGNDNQQHGAYIQNLGRRNGEHGNPNTEPANLSQTNKRRSQVGAVFSERALGKQIKGHAGAAANVAEHASIGAENNAADDNGPNEPAQVEAIAKFRADGHAGREEGKA